MESQDFMGFAQGQNKALESLYPGKNNTSLLVFRASPEGDIMKFSDKEWEDFNKNSDVMSGPQEVPPPPHPMSPV